MRISNIKDDEEREKAKEARTAATGASGQLLVPNADAAAKLFNEKVDLWMAVYPAGGLIGGKLQRPHHHALHERCLSHGQQARPGGNPRASSWCRAGPRVCNAGPMVVLACQWLRLFARERNASSPHLS